MDSVVSTSDPDGMSRCTGRALLPRLLSTEKQARPYLALDRLIAVQLALGVIKSEKPHENHIAPDSFKAA